MYTTILGAAAGTLVAPFAIANISSPVLGAIAGGIIANRWEVLKACFQESDNTNESIASASIERVRAAAMAMIGLGSMISMYGLLSSTPLFAKTALKTASLISASLSEQYALPTLGGAMIGTGFVALLIGKGGMTQNENPLKRGVVWGAVGGILVGASINVETPPCTVAAIWALTFGLLGLNSGFVALDVGKNLKGVCHLGIAQLLGSVAATGTVISAILDDKDSELTTGYKCLYSFFFMIIGCSLGLVFNVITKSIKEEEEEKKIKDNFNAKHPHKRDWYGSLAPTIGTGGSYGLIIASLIIPFTDVKFPGSVRTVGVLTSGLLSLAYLAYKITEILKDRTVTQTTTKNLEQYYETARMLIGGVLPLLIYDQVIPYQPENRAINIVASSVLFPMGAMIAQGFIGKLAVKMLYTWNEYCVQLEIARAKRRSAFSKSDN